MDDSDLSSTAFPGVVLVAPKLLPKVEDASGAVTLAEGDLRANGTKAAASGFRRIVFPVVVSFLSMAEAPWLDKLIILQGRINGNKSKSR